jgi:signal transduction histidine kinase
MFQMAMKTRFNPNLKSLKDLIGPWPIYPLPLALLFFAASQFAASKVLQNEDSRLFKIWFKEMPSSLFYGVICYLTLICVKWLFERVKSERSPLTRYLVLLAIAGCAFELIHQIFIDSPPMQIFSFSLRNTLALVILCGIFGKNSQRLEIEIVEKSEALVLLEEQRELFIEADEKVRREIANFLHDNVQANLVVLAVELRKIATVVDHPHNQEINSVIEEIDDLRALDVRLASRKLSPDIATIGLAATLEELFLEYRKALDISLTVQTTYIPNDLGLGVYRITEQALLNASVHGQASKCSVKLAQDPNNDFVLSVTNNGLPLPANRSSGSGTAVIESWVRKFHGSWSLESNSGETLLRVKFPVTTQ